jgi:hypothetical protein
LYSYVVTAEGVTSACGFRLLHLGNMVRFAMNEKHESKAKAGYQREGAARRAWHAPQFHVAEFGLTKSANHANTDGNKDGVDGTLS